MDSLLRAAPRTAGEPDHGHACVDGRLHGVGEDGPFGDAEASSQEGRISADEDHRVGSDPAVPP